MLTIDNKFLACVYIDNYSLIYQYNVEDGKYSEKMRICILWNKNITTFSTVIFLAIFEILTLLSKIPGALNVKFGDLIETKDKIKLTNLCRFINEINKSLSSRANRNLFLHSHTYYYYDYYYYYYYYYY